MATKTERPERCETCRFWELMEEKHEAETDSRSYGLCHRGLIGKENGSIYDWPCRLSTDWCGEFQPKQAAPKVALPMAVDESRWDEFVWGLPKMTRCALRYADVKSFADLLDRSAHDLRSGQRMGDGGVKAVRVRLAEFGLKLRGE